MIQLLFWTKKDNSNIQRRFHKALVLGDSTTILDKERQLQFIVLKLQKCLFLAPLLSFIPILFAP